MSEPINIEFAAAFDDFWRYSFGTWTHYPRLEGETDEEGLTRIKAETQQAATDAIALIDEERQKRADLHALPYR